MIHQNSGPLSSNFPIAPSTTPPASHHRDIHQRGTRHRPINAVDQAQWSKRRAFNSVVQLYTLYHLLFFQGQGRLRCEMKWFHSVMAAFFVGMSCENLHISEIFDGGNPEMKMTRALWDRGFWPTQNSSSFSPSGSRRTLKLCLWAKLWFLTSGHQLTGASVYCLEWFL